MKGNELEAKRVFISGGCGDIARAIASRFVESGAGVALGDVQSRQSGVRIGRALDPARVIYTPCDVTSSRSIDRAMKYVESKWGGLDVAIGCAGFVANEPFLDISRESWEKT